MVGGSLPDAPMPAPPVPPPPTPPSRSFWKRPIGVAVIVVVALAVIGGIGSALQEGSDGGDEDGASSCSQAAPGWAEQLSMPSGTYVYADAGTASNGNTAWVVKKDDGAVWATDVDPSTEPSSGGLVVPLNDQARQDSDAGVDLTDEAIAGLFPDASVDAVSEC